MFFRSRYLRARPYRSVLIDGMRVPDAAHLDSSRSKKDITLPRVLARHARERVRQMRKLTSVGRVVG